jgi:hypothetical protein
MTVGRQVEGSPSTHVYTPAHGVLHPASILTPHPHNQPAFYPSELSYNCLLLRLKNLNSSQDWAWMGILAPQDCLTEPRVLGAISA